MTRVPETKSLVLAAAVARDRGQANAKPQAAHHQADNLELAGAASRAGGGQAEPRALTKGSCPYTCYQGILTFQLHTLALDKG